MRYSIVTALSSTKGVHTQLPNSNSVLLRNLISIFILDESKFKFVWINLPFFWITKNEYQQLSSGISYILRIKCLELLIISKIANKLYLLNNIKWMNNIYFMILVMVMYINIKSFINMSVELGAYLKSQSYFHKYALL